MGYLNIIFGTINLKGVSNVEWIDRMSATLDYIESHLDDDILYDEVAKIACCSMHQFGRVFSYVEYGFLLLRQIRDFLCRLGITTSLYQIGMG